MAVVLFAISSGIDSSKPTTGKRLEVDTWFGRAVQIGEEEAKARLSEGKPVYAGFVEKNNVVMPKSLKKPGK